MAAPSSHTCRAVHGWGHKGICLSAPLGSSTARPLTAACRRPVPERARPLPQARGRRLPCVHRRDREGLQVGGMAGPGLREAQRCAVLCCAVLCCGRLVRRGAGGGIRLPGSARRTPPCACAQKPPEALSSCLPPSARRAEGCPAVYLSLTSALAPRAQDQVPGGPHEHHALRDLEPAHQVALLAQVHALQGRWPRVHSAAGAAGWEALPQLALLNSPGGSVLMLPRVPSLRAQGFWPESGSGPSKAHAPTCRAGHHAPGGSQGQDAGGHAGGFLVLVKGPARRSRYGHRRPPHRCCCSYLGCFAAASACGTGADG